MNRLREEKAAELAGKQGQMSKEEEAGYDAIIAFAEAEMKKLQEKQKQQEKQKRLPPPFPSRVVQYDRAAAPSPEPIPCKFSLFPYKLLTYANAQ